VTLEEKKNFGLSPDRFTELSDKLAHGQDEELFEHIFLIHFQDCLAYVVKEDQAPEHLAYDATMDAFLTFRMKIAQGKIQYGNLRFLLTRMARQHYYKRVKREFNLPLELADEQQVAPEILLEPTVHDLLSKGWEKIGQTCKQLLRDFYYRGKALKEIASATDRKPEALRKQKQRCLADLRAAVKGS